MVPVCSQAVGLAALVLHGSPVGETCGAPPEPDSGVVPGRETERTSRSAALRGDIMIHGVQSGLGLIGRGHRLSGRPAGRIAVTNGEIEESWKAVPDGTVIEIRP